MNVEMNVEMSGAAHLLDAIACSSPASRAPATAVSVAVPCTPETDISQLPTDNSQSQTDVSQSWTGRFPCAPLSEPPLTHPWVAIVTQG